MLNVLLCDDSDKQVQVMKKVLLDYQYQKEQIFFHIFSTISTKDALKCVVSNTIDIAILDIEIDDKTGIDIAKAIKSNNTECKIIFLTNYDSFGYLAYEVEASAYILKPLEKIKLYNKLDKIIREYHNETIIKRYGSSRFEMKIKGKITYVYQYDILYIEKKGKNVLVVTNDFIYEYIANLKDIEKELGQECFLRCHNGFIVNINQIVSHKRTELYVGKQHISIPVSKANIHKVAAVMEMKIWENII